MNPTNSSMLLIGIGTAGCSITRGISRAFGEGLRHVLVDTDASTGLPNEPFLLLGGARLSGRGAGGDTVAARLAAEESVRLIDEHVEDVRLAVIVAALGGGTGSGVTLEVVKHLSELGIPTIVFATTPFAFEGDDRKRTARGFMTMIEEVANAAFFMSLDKLVQGEDNMETALHRAIDTMAIGVTLFWRLIEKPGYIRLDTERVRHLVSVAGRGRFAAVSVQGPDRAEEAVKLISSSELLAESTAPVRSILCGVLAGDDLRLSEVGTIANGLRNVFGDRPSFDLGTVNDNETFSGRLSVVVVLFETSRNAEEVNPATGVTRKPNKGRGVLGVGPTGRGRFNNAEPTIWNDEDLDIPTFIRKNISLDF